MSYSSSVDLVPQRLAAASPVWVTWEDSLWNTQFLGGWGPTQLARESPVRPEQCSAQPPQALPVTWSTKAGWRLELFCLLCLGSALFSQYFSCQFRTFCRVRAACRLLPYPQAKPPPSVGSSRCADTVLSSRRVPSGPVVCLCLIGLQTMWLHC